MSNVLFSPLPLHERYDLKGSILGRVTKEPSDFRKSELVMKDLDLLSSGAKLCMPPRAYKETEGRLERDVAFLRSIGVMDYSLLVGIHFRGQGIPGFNRLLNLIARHKNRAIFGRRRAFYHLGIIDFLQPYNTKKWLETKYKSKVLFQEERAISSVDPGLYADRFLAFVMGIIQPGD